MIVYKYLPSLFALMALRDERLKVGIASQQNDVFDCFPLVQAGSTPDAQADIALTAETLKAMDDTYGIISFSTKRDNLLLWAHYADCHKGIVLGFEFDAQSEPIKVTYRKDNKREVISRFDIDARAKNDPFARHHLLFTEGFNVKGVDWEYESEYRHFINLRDCVKENGLYFTKFNRPIVKEVILGARCSTSIEDVYRTMYESTKGANFEIFRAKKDEAEMKVNVDLQKIDYNKSWFWSHA